jgi:hypothetical protein
MTGKTRDRERVGGAGAYHKRWGRRTESAKGITKQSCVEELLFFRWELLAALLCVVYQYIIPLNIW